jgi:Holliday junction resolvase RusA-like endonuclease
VPTKSTTRAAAAQMLAGSIPPAKKPDADNISKIALDSLNGIVWVDDAQVVSLFIRKRYATEAGLDIVIRPFLAPAPIEAAVAA